MRSVDPQKVFDAIAKSLVEFGYPDCTPEMIADTYRAMLNGHVLPHGIIGAFAESQLNDAIDMKILAPVKE